MKIEYDQEADAVYIELRGDSTMPKGLVAFTHPINDPAVKGMVNLDYDSNGKLTGIEILDAGTILPKDFLNTLT
jgi:uncharacterized protein YuzE